LETHFGISGRLDPLTSERDQNFRVTGDDGQRYVLKFSNAAEAPEITNFQTEALLHVARAAPDLPVPRVHSARDGRREIPLPSGNVMRLLSWLGGHPLNLCSPDRALRASIGHMAARLTRAFEGFAHPASDHVLLWDIKNAAALRPMLGKIADLQLRRLATNWLDHFDTAIAPVLGGLPWQVVHADLNPHNLLTSPDGRTITGILDFGDMVRTPRLCDLAVAASYHADPMNPLGSLGDVIGAWNAELPLTRAEAALILDLVAMRMVTTVALASWRAALYPENAAYILRNLPASQSGLQALSALGTGRNWSLM
jgi:Ser/Thr protein kinase RdoA (MazF antagonist)